MSNTTPAGGSFAESGGHAQTGSNAADSSQAGHVVDLTSSDDGGKRDEGTRSSSKPVAETPKANPQEQDDIPQNMMSTFSQMMELRNKDPALFDRLMRAVQSGGTPAASSPAPEPTPRTGSFTGSVSGTAPASTKTSSVRALSPGQQSFSHVGIRVTPRGKKGARAGDKHEKDHENGKAQKTRGPATVAKETKEKETAGKSPLPTGSSAKPQQQQSNTPRGKSASLQWSEHRKLSVSRATSAYLSKIPANAGKDVSPEFCYVMTSREPAGFVEFCNDLEKAGLALNMSEFARVLLEVLREEENQEKAKRAAVKVNGPPAAQPTAQVPPAATPRQHPPPPSTLPPKPRPRPPSVPHGLPTLPDTPPVHFSPGPQQQQLQQQHLVTGPHDPTVLPGGYFNAWQTPLPVPTQPGFQPPVQWPPVPQPHTNQPPVVVPPGLPFLPYTQPNVDARFHQPAPGALPREQLHFAQVQAAQRHGQQRMGGFPRFKEPLTQSQMTSWVQRGREESFNLNYNNNKNGMVPPFANPERLQPTQQQPPPVPQQQQQQLQPQKQQTMPVPFYPLPPQLSGALAPTAGTKRAYADPHAPVQDQGESPALKRQRPDGLPSIPSPAEAPTKNVSSQPPSSVDKPKLPPPPPPPSSSLGQSLRNLRYRDDIIEPIDRKACLERRGYDATSVARDILIASGRHPTERPLNEHLKPLLSFAFVDYEKDLATFRWDLVDPGGPEMPKAETIKVKKKKKEKEREKSNVENRGEARGGPEGDGGKVSAEA